MAEKYFIMVLQKGENYAFEHLEKCYNNKEDYYKINAN